MEKVHRTTKGDRTKEQMLLEIRQILKIPPRACILATHEFRFVRLPTLALLHKAITEYKSH